MRNDPEVQETVKNLFHSVAPERAQELSELWGKYEPRFNVLADTGPDGPFVCDAGAYRDVRFTNRAMRVFWLASYIAWEGYRAICSNIQVYVENNEIGNPDLARFREMVNCLEELLTKNDPDSVSFPVGIPAPGTLPNKKQCPEMRATAELAMFVTGWVLLHEVCHLRHQQDGTSVQQDAPPEKFREEEIKCDLFATAFLLDKVDEYANESNEPVDSVRKKREIGIYFALFAMTLISANRWGETDTHPAMERRITEILVKMHADGRSRESYLIALMAFAALQDIYPNAPVLSIHSKGT